MKETIKVGINEQGNGMVLTNMPLEQLVALRDAVNDAIENTRNDRAEDLQNDIVEAIRAAIDEGYTVRVGGYWIDADTDIEVEYEEEE